MVEDWAGALALLDRHPWSSHGVAMRRSQDLPVVDERYLHGMYGSPEEYIDHMRQWSTRYRDQLKEIEDFVTDDIVTT